jgi:antitoxin component of MazEF toxin-antitoxin module
MTRIRTIRKYGNSYVISLFKLDIKDFNIKEGDQVDIENFKLIEVDNSEEDNAEEENEIIKEEETEDGEI